MCLLIMLILSENKVLTIDNINASQFSNNSTAIVSFDFNDGESIGEGIISVGGSLVADYVKEKFD